MKVRYIALVIAVLATTSLLFAGSAGAANGTTSTVPAPESRALPNGDTATLSFAPLTKGKTTSCTGCSYLPEPCGEKGYSATIKYNNYVGINLFTYQQVVYVDFCNGYVTSVPTLYDRAVSSCCGWSWQGNVVKSATPSLPYTLVYTFTEGHFEICGIPYVLCTNKYPWIKLTIGYNGNIWGDSWSTG